MCIIPVKFAVPPTGKTTYVCLNVFFYCEHLSVCLSMHYCIAFDLSMPDWLKPSHRCSIYFFFVFFIFTFTTETFERTNRPKIECSFACIAGGQKTIIKKLVSSFRLIRIQTWIEFVSAKCWTDSAARCSILVACYACLTGFEKMNYFVGKTWTLRYHLAEVIVAFLSSASSISDRKVRFSNLPKLSPPKK